MSCIRSYVEKGVQNAGKTPIWVGASDISEKQHNKHFGRNTLPGGPFQLEPVFLSPNVKDAYYNGFCNDSVWPLFHYFPSYAKFSDAYFESYLSANRSFLEKIKSIYKPGDVIWIHDYHLMLLPQLIRSQFPDATIGFFLHIPFPSFELFRLFPDNSRKELLTGLLGADLVGFHTHDYVQHFLRSVRQIHGLDINMRTIALPDRNVVADCFPAGIDYMKFSQAIANEKAFAERNRIRKMLNDSKIIVSADRLDYTKGLLNRLKGFELFLEKYPLYRGKVAYLLLIVPSRDVISKYKENKIDIEGLVSRINGQYGSIGWTPVIYQYKSLDFEKLAGLYLSADAALICPLRDGMNLVAKEFVASRQDKKGVLILSETAGAASELGEAILVNPTDRVAIADSIYKALTMPAAEQAERNEEMQKRLQTYDVAKWGEDFLSQLLLCKAKQSSLTVKEVSENTEQEIVRDYRRASSRLILLDYDGTLVPISRRLERCQPSEELIALLQLLSTDSRNTLVVVSGRPKEVLSTWFRSIGINLVAEHGAFIKRQGKAWEQSLSTSDEWKQLVLPFFRQISERCPRSFVEEKALSIAWHYRNAEPELGFARSRELINTLLEFSVQQDFQVIEGNMIVEARARGVDKGFAARQWLDKNAYDFVMAAGDDRTDEDLFKAVDKSAYSIRVGLVSSEARYNLRKQSDIIRLLSKLSACRSLEESPFP